MGYPHATTPAPGNGLDDDRVADRPGYLDGLGFGIHGTIASGNRDHMGLPAGGERDHPRRARIRPVGGQTIADRSGVGKGRTGLRRPHFSMGQ